MSLVRGDIPFPEKKGSIRWKKRLSSPKQSQRWQLNLPNYPAFCYKSDAGRIPVWNSDAQSVRSSGGERRWSRMEKYHDSLAGIK